MVKSYVRVILSLTELDPRVSGSTILYVNGWKACLLKPSNPKLLGFEEVPYQKMRRLL